MDEWMDGWMDELIDWLIAADYPYINYYVINKPREEAGQFYTENKLTSHETLAAGRLGYSLNHSMDLYDEVGRHGQTSEQKIRIKKTQKVKEPYRRKYK